MMIDSLVKLLSGWYFISHNIDFYPTSKYFTFKSLNETIDFTPYLCEM